MSTPLSDDEVEDDTEGGKQRARKDESECNGADQGEGALSPRADDGVLGKRKRAKKPVRRLVEEDDSSSTSPAPRGKATGKNNKKTRLKNTERIAEIGVSTSLDFEVGEEVYLREGVHENENFWGEILSINRIKNGEYTLGMANPCHGIWGEAIVRSASKMKAQARRIQFSRSKDGLYPPLIPIEFSLQSAVYDARGTRSNNSLTVRDSLEGWPLLQSWTEDIWTIDPLLLAEIWPSNKINYSILFSLLRDILENKFKPKTDKSFDAYFILPPNGGTIALLQNYIKACERKRAKFSVEFEYVWVFVPKKKLKN